MTYNPYMSYHKAITSFILASWIAPDRPVKRMPVPWSFLQTCSVKDLAKPMDDPG